LKIIKPKF